MQSASWYACFKSLFDEPAVLVHRRRGGFVVHPWSVQITYDILRRRLNMENPHKQWLAVDLVRHSLGQCPERLRPFRSDLIRDVARVADRPNTKGSLAAQQNARKSALEFLQSCGQEGHQALTLVQSLQRGTPSTRNRPIGAGDFTQPFYTTPQGAPGAAPLPFCPPALLPSCPPALLPCDSSCAVVSNDLELQRQRCLCRSHRSGGLRR